MPRDRTYQFQVRAVDLAGNVGAWAVGGCVPAHRRPGNQPGGDVRQAAPGSGRPRSGGTTGAARTTRTAGAIARFTFSGSAVAWVAAVSPLRGAAGVSIDGAFAGTVDTHRTTAAARQIVFSRSWPTLGEADDRDPHRGHAGPSTG